MAKFIEVTVDGIHRLINAEIIEEVRVNWDGGVDIYLAFNCPHATEQCKKAEPPVCQMGEDRMVRCWLYAKEDKEVSE